MVAFFRHILLSGLAIALVLTAETLAMAKAEAAPADEIILCIGHTTQVVYVDEEGQPIEGPHICPDCALFFAALSAHDADLSQHATLIPAVFAQRVILAQTIAPLRAQLARGPPVTV
ncbi:hypothetical protein ACS3SW_07000 [Roseobacteraceae bacterium S113]